MFSRTGRMPIPLTTTIGRSPMQETAGRFWYLLPGAIVLLAIGALLIHGPVDQIAHYHAFADRRAWFGIANAADVLSNLGFGIVGIAGMHLLWRSRLDPAMQPGLAGYGLFFAALFLTAFGSSWYHLAPDNARLVWDRLPIALACGGLLAAVWRETTGSGRWLPLWLGVVAVASVGWWRHTDLQGMGDLRPYLLLQLLPLVLIPLLQYQARRPVSERMAFGAAIALYVVAKACELADHAVFEAIGALSGHTLKHLFASLAAAVLAWRLSSRTKDRQ